MTASKKAKQFKIITLGCKVNQCESSAISHHLTHHGLTANVSDHPVDVCIVNTCAVTGKAAMQSRQAVRRAARENPKAKIIVTGCYAQTSPEIFDQMDVNLDVIPQDRKAAILDNLSYPQNEISQSGGALFPKPGDFNAGSLLDRTRPMLKIQDGCNAFCTYCVVPYARGRSCSMVLDDVLGNLRALEDSGFKEVVLTGIHLGQYGLDLNPPLSLADLLYEIIQSSLSLRVRLSSIEPKEVTDRVIEQVAMDDRFCDHFHVPLQSGANTILKRMGRPYTAIAYAETVNRIIQKIPQAGIGADVMVGFPGESEREFQQSQELVDALPVTYLHVFPFSPRPGTPAADYPNQVPDDVIKQRAAAMRALGQNKRTVFFEKHIGRRATVLVEGRRDRQSGLLKGMSSNYIPVLMEGKDALMNQMVTVRLKKGPTQDYLQGVLE